MYRKLILFFCCLLSSSAYSQNSFKAIFKDSVSKEPLAGVAATYGNSGQGSLSDANGTVVLENIPDGNQTFSFYMVGYNRKSLSFEFPLAEAPVIYLSASQTDLEEVIVSSTRTNSRIDDLPTKVEILGQEDMDEESTLVPGSVASILGDLSIITIQRTDPINGNDAIRMQGLDAKYTQLMRDGLPLYGGFSGSLGVLSIPPLDLKQVEIIKGAASTLYGGGAIGGLINFISKSPEENGATFVLNGTSLGEGNLNSFFSGKKENKGFTFFAGANLKQATDINGDGFTDVPRSENYVLHPRFFLEPNKKTKLVIGLGSSYDKREAGDVSAIRNGPGAANPFVHKEKALRNSIDLVLSSASSERSTVTFKTAGSAFQRELNLPGFSFSGNQYNTYSELNDVISLEKHVIVAGLNFISENFTPGNPNTTTIPKYNYYTSGIFIQDDWQLLKKLSLQAGVRYDHHNVYRDFLLPRISLFYRPGPKLSVRLAAGTGYKTPGIFDLGDATEISTGLPEGLKAENAYGLNSDINYHTILAENLSFEINEAFYYSNIANRLMSGSDSSGFPVILNDTHATFSYGTDTYIRLGYKGFELYLGYNHTEAVVETDSISLNMPFNPKDKLSATAAYEIEGKWRMGLEASFTGNQYVFNNRRVPDFLFMAGMVERKFENCSLVLNCENLLDVRQSQFEPLVSGSRQKPVFEPCWGPVEGRVINLSLRIKI